MTNSETERSIQLIINLDDPHGTIDTYLESFQQKHLDYSHLGGAGPTPLERLRRATTELGDETPPEVLFLLSVPFGPAPLEELAESLPPYGRLIVFAREFRRITDSRVLVQGVPAETDKEFALKVGGHISRLIRLQPDGSPLRPAALPFPDTHRHSASLEEFSPHPDWGRCTARVVRDNVNFDFFCDFRSASLPLIVLGQSALNRSQVTLPLYHRWKWASELNANVIALNDPTLYLDDSLDAGWWVGTPERDYAREMSEIVLKIASHLRIDPGRIHFYGGSAGGFAAFHMAACIPPARVVVDIPQIDLRKYHLRAAVDAAAQVGLRAPDILNVPKEFLYRIDVTERFIKERVVPDFLYLQNLRDSSHLESHYREFRRRLDELRSDHDWAEGDHQYLEYSAWSMVRGGHFPLGRFDTVRHLNRYVDCD